MHVFRIVLKDKTKEGDNGFLDLIATPETSLVNFSQSVKASGGVCNEGLAVPYENILFVQRLDIPDPEGINAPAMGRA